jgi:hypothetical protein
VIELWENRFLERQMASGIASLNSDKCWTRELALSYLQLPVSLTVRTKVWVCERSLAGIEGSNPGGGGLFSCGGCVLSDSRLCVAMITRPQESHRVWCV